MNFIGIIPARWSSTRFPGKPLINIQGKSMIQRVYEQASQSKLLSEIIIATDDERIETEAKKFKAKVVMTSNLHRTGTDRCAEALTMIHTTSDVAINIQGDEPFIHPEQIDLLCNSFINKSGIEISTLRKPIKDLTEIENENVVKVVTDKNEVALYFSRCAIPFVRDKELIFKTRYFKHIGIYAYRVDVLKQIVKLKTTQLEEAENLEQLRWLENGYRIQTVLTENETLAIDTPDDLEKIKSLYL